MKRFLVLLLTLISAGYGLFADDLWNRAVDLTENQNDLKAGRFVFDIEILNKDSSPFLQYEMEQHQEISKDGELKRKTIRAMRNGKDVLHTIDDEKEREDQESQGPETTLFLKETQDSVIFTRLEEESAIRSTPCAAYKFAMEGVNEKGKPVTYSGSVHLALSTGQPMRLSYTVNPAPKMMKEMNTIFDYSYNPEGVLERVNMVSRGIVKVFLSEKSMTTRLVMEELFAAPEQ